MFTKSKHIKLILFLQYVDAVGLTWGADTTPVKQKQLSCEKDTPNPKPREGNGKSPRLIYPLNT